MIASARSRRSALYVPASNARAIEKARGLACDVVILDLEDAIDPQAKAAARDAMVEAVSGRQFGSREVVVRVNGLATPWGEADLAAVRAARPDAVLAPKIDRASDVAGYADELDGAAPLWAMIETCLSVLRLDEIAGCGRLTGLVFGSNDLLAQMGASPMPRREALLGALGLTVTAARAHGLAVLDGVLNDFKDKASLTAECAQAAAFGFDGKTLIHPAQIEACNQAFSPSISAVEHARAVVAAFSDAANAGLGVLVVDGRMTERLHLTQALRTLAIHEAARYE